MVLTNLLSTPAVGWARVALLLALAGAAAGVTWWGLAPRIDFQAERADRGGQDLAEARQMIELQAGVLEQQQAQLGVLADIERRMQQLDQTVNRNASTQTQAIEELKRNDETIKSYLASSVPVALGRLYERPETTDPAAYHGPAGVLPGAVPATGAPGGADQ